MEIRNIKLDELTIVTQLAHAIWPSTFKDILSPEQLHYMLQRMYSDETLQSRFRRGNVFLIMEAGKKPVGFMEIEAHYPQLEQLKIHKLYVLPAIQGKGAGRKFLEKAKSLALEIGLNELTLNVNRYNKSIDFYFRMGFSIEKEEDIAIGNGYLMEDYVMTLSLIR
jgi:GNAT superfamily N-acetyltransferase